MNDTSLRIARAWLAPCAPLLRGKSALVALSGGADSTALAVALAALRGELGLSGLAFGHVDHALRPESGDEALRAGELARSLGIPFLSERLDPPDRTPDGLEAWAREARYAALDRMRERAGCDLTATAHHRMDQAETLTMRLARGTGFAGLAGIRRLDDRRRLVRPLLEADPAELRAWLRELGLRWSEDPSNSDQRIARNAVRHRILPAWEAREPGAAATLSHVAGLAGELLPALRAWARRAYPFAPLPGRRGGPPAPGSESRPEPPAPGSEPPPALCVPVDPDDLALDDGALLRLACDEVWTALGLPAPESARWDRLMTRARAGQPFSEQLGPSAELRLVRLPGPRFLLAAGNLPAKWPSGEGS